MDARQPHQADVSSIPYRTTPRGRESVRRPEFLRRDYYHDDERALVLRGRETETFERPERPERIERIERRPLAARPISPPPPINMTDRKPVNSTGPSLLKGTQAVLGPSLNHDTTIHLQLDIEEDLESRLEEFSRLARLGNFRGAEEYFQDNLQKFIDIPPVSVELADMLLCQGAYKRLKELRQENKLKPPPMPEDMSLGLSKSKQRRDNAPNFVGESDYYDESDFSADSDSSLDISHYNGRIDKVKHLDSDADRFDITFHLIETSSYMFSQGWLNRAFRAAMKTKRELAPNSTSMHNILLSIDILTYVKDESDLVDGYSYYELIANCSTIYRHLLEQGRIWEVKDLISACISAYGAKRAWRILFDADLHSPDFFTKFLREWKADRYDPSTYLALLAILVALSRYLVPSSNLSSEKDSIATAKRCLEQARDLAASIKENNPEYIKSRPYIQWILVQEELSRKLGYEGGRNLRNPSLNFQHLQRFPGLTIWPNNLPAYIPVEAENPGSHVSHFLDGDNELLQIALQASEELGDYETQVLCLRELICRAKEPKQLFDKLTNLQKSVQGDVIGYLQTCISKYLYATTDESRQALIDEFADFDGRQAMSYSIQDPLVLWQERRVQRALYLSMGLMNEARNAQHMARKCERDLPSDVKNAISRLRISSNTAAETERTIEREFVYVEDQESGQGRERDRNDPNPQYVETRKTYTRSRPSQGDEGLDALSIVGPAALAGKKHVDRTRSQFQSRSRSRSRSIENRQRRVIRRQSSLDTSNRKPLTREVEGLYGSPRTIVDHREYVKKPWERKRSVFQEQERATTDEQLMIDTNPGRDSHTSIEEVRREFPPPGTGFARNRAVEWPSVLSNSREDAEENDAKTNAQGNIVEEPLTERQDGETEDEYKQRIENYVSHYQKIQERLNMAVARAKSRLHQMNKTHVSPEQMSKGGKNGQIHVAAVERQARRQERDRTLTPSPPEGVRARALETREEVQEREKSHSPYRHREEVAVRSVGEERSSSQLRSRVGRERTPSPISFHGGSPAPIRLRDIKITMRGRSPSTQEDNPTKDSGSDPNTSRGKDGERKEDKQGDNRHQTPNFAATGLEPNQTAQKTNGGVRNGSGAETPASGKTEELTDNEVEYRIENLEDESRENEFPKRGKTRMPARLVNKRAIIDLGYPFSEEGETIIIHKALGPDSIDELIKLSDEYNVSRANERSIEDRIAAIEDSFHVSPLSHSRVAADKDIGAEDLKRRHTFPTSEEMPDDGKP